MKKLKVFLASITALSCLCAGCLPMAEQIPSMDFVIANAEDEEDTKEIATSGTCGENLTWNFDESTGTLTISGTGAMNDYSFEYAETPDWIDLSPDIKKIILEDGVTTIGTYAFWCCETLTSVTIPDSVTIIGSGAFIRCLALESVTIPDSVTEIGYNAFACCALKSVVIPDSVTTINASAFESCEFLTSVTIPDCVATIGGSAFYDTPWLEIKRNENPLVIINHILIDGQTCKQEEIIIPDGVTAIAGEAFSHTAVTGEILSCCESLRSVTIPDSVTSIGDSAFYGCAFLTSVIIENPACEIYDADYTVRTIPETATIYGYENSTAKAYAEKYGRNFISLGTAPEILTGDANKDGEFDILDVIVLQKWLLGAGSLPDWKAVDFNQDRMINIFDLLLAKQSYLEKLS